MHLPLFPPSAAAALALAALCACAANTRAPGGLPPAAAPAPISNPADVRFITGMIVHHSQALAMSALATASGASASVRTLAERIGAGQLDEIALMQSWLRDRGQPIPRAGAATLTMTMNGMKHEMSMPGMLTEAKMRQLQTARGPAFDRLFLTFMIEHHRGAVAMVEELFATSGAAQEQSVFKLASDVSADQSSEIARMRRMLLSLDSEARSP